MNIVEQYNNGQRCFSGVDLSYADIRGVDLSYVDLRGADLRNVDLSQADMRGADLRDANLYHAYLTSANLYHADMRGADLSDVNLRSVCLRDANLSYADLYYADLRDADLSYANLYHADLRDANLSYADLSCADLRNVELNNRTCGFFSRCPEKGSFIGYKAIDGKILKIQIPNDAKRSSATSNKCRADKAISLALFTVSGSEVDFDVIASDYDGNFLYKKGELSYVEDFDNNRWNECSTGIHFFITFEEAVCCIN